MDKNPTFNNYNNRNHPDKNSKRVQKNKNSKFDKVSQPTSNNKKFYDPQPPTNSNNNQDSQPTNNNKNNLQGFYTKYIKNEKVQFDCKKDAQLFVECIYQLKTKDEILCDLKTNLGQIRIRECIQYCSEQNDMEVVLFPLISFFQSQELEKPMFKGFIDEILYHIYLTPFILEIIQKYLEQLQQKSQIILCKFLRQIAVTYNEARCNDKVKEIGLILLKMKTEGSEQLSQIICLKNDEKNNYKKSNKSNELKNPIWITDKRLPGDRHNNDKDNFRDISIIPTVQEISCNERPFLPLRSKENKFLDDPFSHLIDSQFRLLRHDNISELESFYEKPPILKNIYAFDILIASKDNSNRYNFNDKPCIKFKFELPEKLKGKSKKDQQEYWEKHFKLDTLVCFTQNQKPILYGSITNIDDHLLNDKNGPFIGIDLETDETFQHFLKELSFFFINFYDLHIASKQFFSQKPILQCLQKMDTLPMIEEIVLEQNSKQIEYLPSRIIFPKQFKSIQIDRNRIPEANQILKQTSLDKSQIDSILNTINQRVALIQGPPGCGKTFIGSLLAQLILQNAPKVKILCLCYTNHALDQFLEILLDLGINDITRIGGRSKSERISQLSVHNLAKSKFKQTNFKQIIETKQNLEEIIKNILMQKQILYQKLNWKDFRDFLSYYNKDILKQFLINKDINGDGFTTIGLNNQNVTEDYAWDLWVQGKLQTGIKSFDQQQQKVRRNIWQILYEKRIEMIRKWNNEIKQPIIEQISKLLSKFKRKREELQLILRQNQYKVVDTAKVIGATTTGAAIFQDLIKSSQPDVLIVEEAGEILESHVLVSLTKKTKHLILIGDHQQLRSKIQTYELKTVSKYGYDLDCSLFERLVKSNNIKHFQLNVQHRMRPEISQIIRQQTYHNLLDADNVKEYPDLKGIMKNIVFMDHQNQESQLDNKYDKTKTNTYESEIVVEIVRLLLLQGYKQNQLVVLTPYLGQLKVIQLRMRKQLKDVYALIDDLDVDELKQIGMYDKQLDQKKLEGVRVATVDNYQGEESDIVIISIVRSNKEGNIGFLYEPERVNVMLSRARIGMIIIGNSQTLTHSKGNELWTPMLEYFKNNGNIHFLSFNYVKQYTKQYKQLLHFLNNGIIKPYYKLIDVKNHKQIININQI